MIKKILYILILMSFFSLSVKAYEQHGQVEKNIYGYEFKSGDSAVFLRNAKKNLYLYEHCQTSAEKKKYLNQALRYYYMLSKADRASIDAHIGLGKCYDDMNLDRYAKEHFYHAFNINNKNPELNYRFGDFYYKRKQLSKAQFYFARAYSYGYSKNYDLNYKMAKNYEMLADIEEAKKFYQNAQYLKPQNEIKKEIKNKIRLLDDLNYSNSQYYLFIK